MDKVTRAANIGVQAMILLYVAALCFAVYAQTCGGLS